jgi:hypothetical protein
MRSEHGVDAIEVGTLFTFNESKIFEMMAKKLDKYKDLIGNGISKFNVLIINHRTAYALDGELSLSVYEPLIEAYRFGMRLKKEFFRRLPGARVYEDADKVTELRATLRTYNPIHSAPVIPEMVSPTVVRIEKLGIDPEILSFEQMMIDRSPGRTDKKSICHVPWASVEHADDQEALPDFPGTTLYDCLHMSVINCLMKPLDSRSYDELQMDYQLGIKETKRHPDLYSVHVSKQERVAMGQRGVMGKSLDPTLKENTTARQKTPLSSDVQTSDIRQFCCATPSLYNDSALNISELNDCHFDDSVDTLATLMSDALKLPDAHSAHFLEMCLREVSYNYHRNPRDKMAASEFIVRRVPGYAAAIIIRTTQMADETKPVFFSVVAKIRGLLAHSETIFEKWHVCENGWFQTDFVSFNDRKLEHLTNLVPQMMSLLGLVYDQIIGRLGPDTKVQHLKAVLPCWRSLYLILIEDKQETSETLQLLRYYYMELLSKNPGSLRTSQKITGKFRPVFRSRLNWFFMQELIRIHSNLNQSELLKALSGKQEDVWAEQESSESERSDDNLQTMHSTGLPTPFFFDIFSADQMLLAAYAHMLHNKNESNFGHGYIQILEKMCKVGYKALNARESRGGSSFVNPTDILASEMTDFEINGPMVKKGLELMMKEILDQHGVSGDGREWFETKILKFCLKTTLSELCTTKSTTIPFDEEIKIRKDGKEISEIGKRKKVFQALYEELDEFMDPKLCMSISIISEKIRNEENGKIQVTMFKKNQIGGTREIYVLTIWGRLMIRFYNDVYRAICKMHPSERLTDDTGKDRFIAEHFNKCADLPKHQYTLRVSSDKSSWAQNFSLDEFLLMNQLLLPASLIPVCQDVVEMHKRKVIQLPPQTLMQFISGRAGELTSENAGKLRDEFTGKSTPRLLRSARSPNVDLQSDFLMGIFHYPSSVYHLAHLHLVVETIKSLMNSVGCAVVASFEVSSDDEGLLVTIAADSLEDLKRHIKTLMSNFKHVLATVDKYFNVKTSFEKTTVSGSELFEFNSKFYVRNTVASPLIKFVSRACDDHLAESLHGRVSGYNSSLRQVRENGASGYVCHWVSICQAIAYYMNLGWQSMKWFKSIDQHFPYRTSYEGFLPIWGPTSAGFCTATLADWFAATHRPGARSILSRLGNMMAPQTLDDLESLNFGVFPVKKFRKLLDRMHLSPDTVDAEINAENLESLLSSSTSMAEERIKIKRAITRPGVAASLSWHSRTEVIRMTPYLLWASIFRSEKGKLTRDGLLRKMSKTDPYPIEVLFPMHESLVATHNAIMSVTKLVEVKRFKRLTYSYISPMFSHKEHREQIKSILLARWYHRDLDQILLEQWWPALQRDVPFLMDTPLETLDASPFDTYSELLGFIESFGKTYGSMKVLARGRPHRDGDPLILMLKDNLATGYEAYTEYESDRLARDEIIGSIDHRRAESARILSDRMHKWEELLRRPSPELMDEHLHRVRMDMTACVDELQLDGSGGRTIGVPHLEDNFLLILLMTGKIDLQAYCARAKDYVIYREIQTHDGTGGYSGNLQAYVKRGPVSALLLKKEGKGIAAYSTASLPELRHRMPRWITPSSVIRQAALPPAGRCVALRMIRGNRCLVIDDSQTPLYIQMPWSRPYPISRQLQGDCSQWARSWILEKDLTRADIVAVEDAIKLDIIEADLVQSSLSYVNTINNRKMGIRFAERMQGEQLAHQTEDEELAETMALLGAIEQDEEYTPDFIDLMMNTEVRESHNEETFIDFQEMHGDLGLLEIHRPVEQLLQMRSMAEIMSSVPEDSIAHYLLSMSS